MRNTKNPENDDGIGNEPDEFETVERFREIVRHYGGTKQFSDLTGISQAVISRHLNERTRELSGKSIVLMANNANVNIYWYLLGEGEMLRPPVSDREEYVFDGNMMERLESAAKALSELPRKIREHTAHIRG